MEYTYSLTTSYDGELVNTLRVNDMLEAVNAWEKCVDYGFAKNTQPITCLTQRVRCILKPSTLMERS